jgi:hypothetical protein
MKRIPLAIAMFVLAVLVGASTAAPATAAALVNRDTITMPIQESGVPDECRPGITGEVSGTEVIEIQSVETSTGFHVYGTSTDTGRIDWSDGSYTIIESVDQFSFNTGKQTFVFTNAHEDSGNTYSASGEFLFRITLHSVEHFTVSGGVTRVEFGRGQPRIFGDC